MADGLRFTDLTQLQANNVNGQDIVPVSHYNAGSYSSMSLQIQDLGRAELGNLSYTTELPNFGNQTVFGALLQLLANFANVYNPANTYALNSCVIYQGILYKCTTAITTPEAWDSTHWTAIKAVDVGSGGGGGGASSLTQLSDVTITSGTLADKQFLMFDSGSNLWINASYSPYTDVTGTLTAGQTSITLSDNAITTSSTIEVFNDLDIPYNSKTVSTGSITLTFDAQVGDMSVKVRVS